MKSSLPTKLKKPSLLSKSSIAWLFELRFGLAVHVSRERREHRVFKGLLEMVPGLEERIMNGMEDQIAHIVDMVC